MHSLLRSLAYSILFFVLSGTTFAQVSNGGAAPLRPQQPGGPGAAAAAAPGGPGGPGGGGGGTVNTEAETIDRMTVREDLTPYGVDLLGERLDLATGSLTFQHVDLSIPGNSGLSVEVRRSLRTSGGSRQRFKKAFGDWSLDVPSLSMTVATVDGWKSNRCTQNSEPDDVFYLGKQYMSWDFWNGLHLNIPGQGSQRVLDNPQGPMNGTGIEKATTNYWKIECISIGSAGEGFVATSPAGIKYTFDHLAYEPTTWVGQLERDTAYMLATKVEDRHGNYVNYNYASGGKITSITSNDGRTISFAYSGNRVSSITASGRTWTYTYTGQHLTKVTLPSSLYWTISVAQLVNAEPKDGLKLVCGGAEPTATGYIKHPYGTRGDYTINEISHGRSKVLYQYIVGAGTSNGTCIGEDVRTQRSFDTLSLTAKQLSGPGLSTMNWSYTYSQTQGGWTTSSGVSDVNTTTVIDPEGDKTIHYFDRTYTWKENAAVKTRVYDGASTLLRAVDSSFVQGPYIGNGYVANANDYAIEYPRSVSQRVITENGNTFTTAYTHNYSSTCYDYASSWQCYNYGVPARIVQSNSINSHTYAENFYLYSDRANWQFAMPKATWDGTAYKSMTFYTAKNLPYHEKRYNEVVVSRGFYADGTVYWERQGNDAAYQTVFSNWYRGMPRYIRSPDQKTRTFVVDYFGNVTQAKDRAGNYTNYSYDSSDRLTLINYPDESGSTRLNKSLSYSTVTSGDINQSGSGLASGQWKQTKTRGTLRQTRYLDALLRPVLVKTEDTSDSSLTRFSRTDFDSASRATFQSFPSGSASASTGTDSEFDGLGRLKEVEENVTPYAKTTYAYLSGNKVRVTNPRGKQTTTTFFALGSPDQSLPTLIQQPLGVTTTITRNKFGEMTQATQSGGGVSATRYYRYDLEHRLCRQVDPETGSTAYSYDSKGRMEWVALAASGSTSICNPSGVPASQRTYHSYNNLNQLTLVNYPDSSYDVSYSYDNNGNLKTLQNGHANWTYSYNKVNALKSESLLATGQTFGLSYAFDTQDRLTSITYPSGQVVSVVANAYGEADSVGSYASNIDYHANGVIESISYGNGRTYETSQNPRQMTFGLLVRQGSTYLRHIGHNYDANGNITSIGDLLNSAYSRAMTYDDLDRLSTASGIWGSGSYTYDALGNIKTKVEGGQTMTYGYDTAKNRLSSITGANAQWPTYDAFGNVVYDSMHTYTYNRAGNMRSSTNPTILYLYDGHNRRARTVNGSQVTYTVYSSGGQLMHKSEGGVKTDYIYAGNQLIAKKQGTAVHYVHTDLLGSPIDGITGSTSYTENYKPWGEKVDHPVQLSNDIGYTGHQSDIATNLTYMQARYYDPVVGRFMAVDPVDFSPDNPMSFNRYSYVNNNPYRYTDPTGEVAESAVDVAFVTYDVGQVIAAVAAYTVGAATGNDALKTEALAGLKENSVHLAGDAAGLAIPGMPAGLTRAASNSAEVAGEAARGMRNPKVREAAEKGREKHREFAEKVSQKPGWKSETTITGPSGEKLRPDAITPSGRPVELKPNTPSGRRQGAVQIEKYKNATGTNGRVVYYDP